MRNRARKFPALVNCTVIDWFQPWPMDALYNVGAKFLEPIEQLGPQDSQVRLGIMDFLPFSFEAAGANTNTSCSVKWMARTSGNEVYGDPEVPVCQPIHYVSLCDIIYDCGIVFVWGV